MPTKKKPVEPENTPPAITQLPAGMVETLAPLLAKAKNLELPILRTSDTLLRMQGDRDKILAYKKGMVEAFCLANDLDPQTTILAPDGKTLIIK